MKLDKKREQQIHRLEDRIHGQAKKIFNRNALNAHPVVRASQIWDVVREQLNIVLGEAIYTQWFAKTRAIVIADNILIVKTENDFGAKWLSSYYLDLVETLLTIHRKDLSCFFLGPSDVEKIS